MRLATSRPLPVSHLLATETRKRMNQVTSALGRGGPPQRRRMTPYGESRMTLEATRPNTLLGKRAIRMGTWNVRTMYETGKTSQIAAEIRACKVLQPSTVWTQ